MTDPKRRDSLIIGLVASIVQNILKSGLSITEAMAIIADAEAWLSQPIDDLAKRVSYKDSYYLSKSLGDIMSMLIGLFGVASGIATFIGSFGLGAGSVVAAPGTAGASLVGIAVSVEGALVGSTVASGSVALAGTAFSSFGKDFNGFTNNKGSEKQLTTSEISFSQAASTHMEETGRFVPVQTLVDAINYGKAIPDPKGSRAIMYTIEMVKNGNTYTLEVLYDATTKSIWHFMYK